MTGSATTWLVTASRLSDGAVVYLGRDGAWEQDIDRAARLPGPQKDAALDQASRDVLHVIGAYAVNLDGERSLRERIRAQGPTVALPAHGPEFQTPAAGNTQPPWAGAYRYDDMDRQFIQDRVRQFRQQVQRRLAGDLSEDEFRTLRLMNGLYLQNHAYMLRAAIPYGVMTSTQMRRLARVARMYDRGYGHFTTRQNLQFNWIKLEQAPDALAELADVNMHAIQTSGNCIRNVTTDQFAGATVDEVADPRVYAEILRQWSLDHPEFSFLPRKFKIAVSGGRQDRAAIRVHDIGLLVKATEGGSLGLEVWVGGGLGRTPIIGKRLREWLAEEDLIAYLEAILRVYNAHGRRDNLYKARLKILVQDLGIETFARQVEEEFARLPRDIYRLPAEIIQAIRERFPQPNFERQDEQSAALASLAAGIPGFARWLKRNAHPHRETGYCSVVVSLKPPGGIPGDLRADQMDALAALADFYSFGEIRVTHEQNLVLPHVRQHDLLVLWRELASWELATANIGLIGDMVSCPGMDYCSLANCRSIPATQQLAARFGSGPVQEDFGPLTLNVSGCINACAHHHVANIGLLGVDKKGQEFYQITLGGSAGETAAIGEILGAAVPFDQVADAVETVMATFTKHRMGGETFIETFRRIGIRPFKEAVYAAD
ncbi:MAG: DUF2849 domain-containing protein [Magnetospirillum sp.]|nr:DUF2849 domain-containing protein [Magnetospirillum sp.]